MLKALVIMTDTFDIQPLFPDSVTAICCQISRDAFRLYPEEYAAVQHAVDKRQREFAAGRLCARRALEHLGYPQHILIKKTDGSPSWPEGIVGSIAHSHTWCAAAAAKKNALQGIGLDIEIIKRVNLNIAPKVMTEQELQLIEDVPPHAAQEILALIFSAKESVYKCLYPVCRKRLDFHDAVILPCPARSSFEVHMAASILKEFPIFGQLSGNYIVHDGNVFTGLVLPA